MRRKEQGSSETNPAATSPDSGFYVLILKVDSPTRIRVGAIGVIAFRPGYYAYCGSARRGLQARLSRHSARRKKKRWHIDYLTCRSEVAVGSIRIFPRKGLTECRLNEKIMRFAGVSPIHGFGCSDCACVSHLSFHGSESPVPILM